MGSVLLRTIQVLVATMLIAIATIAIMWVLGLIDPAAVKTSVYRIGGVLGICLLAALGMVAVFSIGGKNSDQ
jgi:hypothetical protein